MKKEEHDRLTCGCPTCRARLIRQWPGNMENAKAMFEAVAYSRREVRLLKRQIAKMQKAWKKIIAIHDLERPMPVLLHETIEDAKAAMSPSVPPRAVRERRNKARK